MLKFNPTRILLGVLLIAVVWSFSYLAKKRSANKDDAKLYEIQQLYSTLPLAQGLKQRGSSFQSKAESALVSSYFDSSVSFDEINAFYRKELADRGWVLTGDESLTDWGRDFGGRLLKFRKQDYWLVLEYAGNRDDQWDVAITLSWKSPT